MSSGSSSTRCAGCKHLRRKCNQDCILAPYFPPTDPQRFACVHKIFGAGNVTRMLQQLPVEERSWAAESFSTEAYWRVCDPVRGSAGVVYRYKQEIEVTQRELAQTQAQIAMYSSQQQQQPPLER